MNQTELNVIIPAYNEEDRIYHTLEYTVKQLSSFTSSFHIYCVNDGSEDHTGDEIQRFASQSSCVTRIDNDGNQGKGYALRHGVISCGPSEYIAFLDADLDIDPIQLKKYLEIMKGTGCDVVIGSKMHKDSEVDYPTRRRILSYGYYFIVRILFHLHVHDTQTGIKLFRYECIKKVMPKILVKRFAYDIEVRKRSIDPVYEN